jgi:hypothetical protein
VISFPRRPTEGDEMERKQGKFIWVFNELTRVWASPRPAGQGMSQL